MQHQIPVDSLGVHGHGMARAVGACVHCGFCLAACPTYQVLGEEMDSPRGRIVLMKQVLEGDLAAADALPYIDRCLDCLACETACPSGVQYRDLLVPFRSQVEKTTRSTGERLFRQTLLTMMESPTKFRAAIAMGRFAKVLAPLMPKKLHGMLSLLPGTTPAASELPTLVPARGRRRARVALLAGCVQRVLRPSINAATLRVLAANGVEIVIPREQGCCGALATHSGFEERGHALASRNAAIFPRDIDAIVTNAAGCGSAMKEHEYTTRVQDVAEFLHSLGVVTPLAFNEPITIAYHDACHLSHGQRIRLAPRQLLQGIGHVTLTELADAEMCCGSAGLYNLEQPETAAILGRRKADAIRASGAQIVATGNIGCVTQIETHVSIPVRHTIEILDSAYIAHGGV